MPGALPFYILFRQLIVSFTDGSLQLMAESSIADCAVVISSSKSGALDRLKGPV